MYMDQDEEIKQENETVVIIKDFLKFVLYSGIINFINYSLRLPAVFSILPLMILLLMIMLFTRYWKNKKRQYAILIPYVAEYFGFCLYFYNRGELMPLTALCMTAILAAWGVFCIECLCKDKKKNLTGLVLLALVAAGAYFGLWAYYSQMAQKVTQKFATAPSVDLALAQEVDSVSKELNVVFYSKQRVTFQLANVIGKMAMETDPGKRGEISDIYEHYVGNLKSAEGKWIKTLVFEGEELSKNLEKIYLND